MDIPGPGIKPSPQRQSHLDPSPATSQGTPSFFFPATACYSFAYVTTGGSTTLLQLLNHTSRMFLRWLCACLFLTCLEMHLPGTSLELELLGQKTKCTSSFRRYCQRSCQESCADYTPMGSVWKYHIPQLCAQDALAFMLVVVNL